MTVERTPAFRIWVPGRPRSFQRRQNTKAKQEYIARIKEAAEKVVPFPTGSGRLDIEIFFLAERSLRADVDNIIKPILDALRGVVYEDDRQVRSVRAVAVAADDAVTLTGRCSWKTGDRSFESDGKEFFVDVYHGRALPGWGTDPKPPLFDTSKPPSASGNGDAGGE